MRLILSIPVLAIVIAAYLAMASGGAMFLDGDAFDMPLASGAQFALRTGDVFVLAGLVALFFEMLKAARLRTGTIVDHMLSTAAFVVALVCFLLVDACGTAPFFLLTIMALIDVVAGFSVSILSARRDFSVSHGGDGGL
jgi:hypothetical protein